MRISRSTGVLSGLLVLILGVWAGLIPFIGPYFHYSFGSSATWHYSADRFWLDILPALVVILGSLVLLRSANRVSGVVGCWMAIAGGAWLAVGPAVSRLWEHGGGPIGQPLYGSTRQMLELVGYFYGVGVLIAVLSAFALGRFVSRPAVAQLEPAYAAQDEPSVEGDPTKSAQAVVSAPVISQAQSDADAQPLTQAEPFAESDPVDEPVRGSDRRHAMRDRRQTATRSSRATSLQGPPSAVATDDDFAADDPSATPTGAAGTAHPRSVQ